MSRKFRTTSIAVVTASLFSACSDEPALAPQPDLELEAAIDEMRLATALYHDLDAAIADGFVLLHECEERPGEDPVGIVYVQPERIDGIIDPSAPEGLLYEPGPNGEMALVGVELAIPYSAWSADAPPHFHGARFQPEDEFGVFGLHVWAWRYNPKGVFGAGNPRVTCEPTA